MPRTTSAPRILPTIPVRSRALPRARPTRVLARTCRSVAGSLHLGLVLGLDLVPLRLLRRGHHVAQLGAVLLVQRIHLVELFLKDSPHLVLLVRRELEAGV